MATLLIVVYALVLIAFIALATFAVIHALKYRYLSPRIIWVTSIFVLVSVTLIGFSVFLVMRLI